MHCTDRGLEVGHVVLEARPGDFVMPRSASAVALPRVALHSMKAPQPRFIDECGRAHKCSAFARGEVLGCVEAEGNGSLDAVSVADVADRLPVVLGGQRVGGVFEHGKAESPGDVEDSIHLGRLTGEVDRKNHLRPRMARRNASFDGRYQ